MPPTQIKPINVYNINSDLYKTKKSDSKDSDQINFYRSLPKKRVTRLFVVIGLLCFFFVAFWLHISLSKVEKLKNEAISLIKQKHPQSSTKSHILLPINIKLNRADRFGGRKVTDSNGVESICPVRNTKTDVQMLDTYAQLPFDNFNNHGPWSQGFNITYNQKQVKKEKTLEVVVMPHSHSDPGWLMTFEEYYQDKVENILTKMLKHLHYKKDMKFIYAEMSFFELWWSKLSEDKKEQTRSFLRSGQLEIVTGGWVMTDEANSRSFSIVMELFEGHEFLRNQLQYTPQSHWAIDPFGLSATVANLVKSAKLTQMVINRAHYEVKKHLAKSKQLEFRWRQLYAGESDRTDIRTHMVPFSSYIISRSCGPDPKICCQFDFGAEGCKWNTSDNIDYITEQNLEDRAAMLYDQYRKKAQLYRMNTLLVPLGNDFRWDTSEDWNDQYVSYTKIFDYMNKKEEWNIKARFGTLKDYFDLLDKRLSEEPANSLYKDLPTLSGDFFTYADFDDNYWSGYFTSRPFYKHMDRTVQHYVRSADILFALAMWKAKREHKVESALPPKFYDMLVQSRRSLSLFQHHDGVTGTSKNHVVVDYSIKMLAAIEDSLLIINKAAAYLLDIPASKPPLKSNFEYYTDKLPKSLKVETGSVIIFHNSLAFERREVVCLRVSSAKNRIQYGGSVNLRQQIQPRFLFQKDQIKVQDNDYDLCFEATAKSLGTERYVLIEGTDSNHMTKVQISAGVDKNIIPDATTSTINDIVSISNKHLTATFDSKTGYLESVQYANEKVTSVQMEFLYYLARKRKVNSPGSSSPAGAYLFLPDGPATPMNTVDNVFVVMKGDVRQTLLLKGPKDVSLFQQVRLDFNSNYLDVVNRVDVRSTSNFELAMRLNAMDFNGQDEQFYTDLNGFQMIRRMRFKKLPIQAHFFPMTTAAFVDSNGQRLTLLGRQSLGVASLEAGQVEVILDRRLMQDDDRGLEQGVTDNHETESHFRLFLEKIRPQLNVNDNRIGYLSTKALQISNKLNYPLTVMHAHFDMETTDRTPQSWTPLKKPFPCDTHLFAFRTLSEPTIYSENGKRSTEPKFKASLILERQGTECLIEEKNLEHCDWDPSGKFNIAEYFDLTPTSVKSTSLTGLYETEQTITELQMNPMDLKALKIEF